MTAKRTVDLTPLYCEAARKDKTVQLAYAQCSANIRVFTSAGHELTVLFTRVKLTFPQDLTTVNENANLEEQLHAGIAAELALANDVDAARRTSVHSGISGTTAKTSFSQEEIGELDPDVMVDVLPSLAAAADELAKLLVPADPKLRPVVLKEIRTAGSKYNKLYNNRLSSLNIHKDSYGSTPYVEPSIALRALLGVQNTRDLPHGPWRPDSVIYKINLAQMLRGTLILLFDNAEVTSEGYNAMEALDVHFASAIAGPEFRQNAFQLCLSLLAQLAIIRLTVFQLDPSFDARSAITNTFFAQDEDGDLAFRHRTVLHMMELPQDEQNAYTNIIAQLADHIIGTLESSEPVIALGVLRAQYPREQFVELVVHYYQERKQELDEQIAVVGGIDQMMIGLSEEVQHREDARVAEEKRLSFTKPGGTPKKGFGKSGIRALKAREKQLTANAVPAPAPTPAVAPIAQMTESTPAQRDQTAAPMDDGWMRQEEDDQIMEPAQLTAQSTARSTLEALSGLQDVQRQNAAKGKGRSFIDRQDGARRVAWDETQLTQYSVPGELQYPASSAPAQGPYYQSPRRSSPGKRPYGALDDEPEEFDPTQDQGFEVDQRDLTAADQRRREALQPRAPQPRFSSLASGEPGPSGTRASTTPSPSKRRRKNPGSTIPPSLRPFDPEDDMEIPKALRLQRAKIAARHTTVMASQAKPAQIRTPWLPEEDQALIDLIEEEGSEGVSYAKLKSYDADKGENAKLSRRSAEDLRFKARNLKVMFLK